MSRHREQETAEAAWRRTWADSFDRLARADLGPLTAGLIAAAEHLRRDTGASVEPLGEPGARETVDLAQAWSRRRAG